MTLIELKAEAYNAFVQVEAWQKKLQGLNKEIAEYPTGTDPKVGETTSEATSTNEPTN